MKNQLKYEGLYTKPKNMINLERLIFLKERKRQIKPTVKLSSQLDQQVIEHIKNYLTQQKYRPLISNSFGNKQKKQQLRTIIHSYVSSQDFLKSYSALITDYSLEEISDTLVEKIAGLDVLQPLTEVPTITDIKCFSYDNIWVDDINKGLYKVDIKFNNKQDYLELCHRFAYASAKSFSNARPSVNAQLPYMRVNFVGEDLSTNISLAIRMISKELRFDEKYMLETGYASQPMIDLLKKTYATESHLISGEPGTGKTEHLRYFARYTQENKVIIMIEDTPETYLDELYPHKPIDMWKNREASDDGKQSFGYEYHVQNAVRQDPTYIFIQEVRSKEAIYVLEAAETSKVNNTIHGTSAFTAVNRFVSLCQKGQDHRDDYYGKRIVDGFTIGIHVERFGKIRKINQLVEYTGYENNKAQANILFEYDPISGKHVQKSTMSKELWQRLEIHFGDISDLECLSPTK
jgi:pilus assembly protein CpaF